MNISFGKNKLKVTALVLCAIITAGSLTYVNYSSPLKSEAKTISDLESEKAENEAEIEKSRKSLTALTATLQIRKLFNSSFRKRLIYRMKILII